MQRVFVLDSQKQPLMPCHGARARMLLKTKRAAVYRRFPFTIILKYRIGGELQSLEAKIDPGSKTSGVALVTQGKKSNKVVWAAHIHHRGDAIRAALASRRALRRLRRSRHTRYRAPCFDNRKRPMGWLAPSLRSRVDNIITWIKRLLYCSPITNLVLEEVRFDTQRLQNPAISGIEYQQGNLFGYEVKEYILEKWQRACAYCDAKQVPLEVEHIVPTSKGGSHRVSNLTLACRGCNLKKGNASLETFLSKDLKRLARILNQLQAPLKDAATVNATRYAIRDKLKQFDLPLSCWSGARTKFNRSQQGYAKDHWIDAACIGETGARVTLTEKFIPVSIIATGRGSRQMCRVDRYGFPRTKGKSQKQVQGFKTGDLVQALVTQGKKVGYYFGRLAVRTSGNFNIKTLNGVVQGIHYKYCQPLHSADGYNYNLGGGVSASC
ncbi:MAG: HNH endonuclease [Proteobacteria bacterium]|nr:HNH endonuclease [Pseudomonadota bacterium]